MHFSAWRIENGDTLPSRYYCSVGAGARQKRTTQYMGLQWSITREPRRTVQFLKEQFMKGGGEEGEEGEEGL